MDLVKFTFPFLLFEYCLTELFFVASSASEDHFSDASEGRKDNSSTSPIPITRVERVDNKPAHGEVPGTEAFKIRQSDADPDELKVVPELGDGQSSNGGSNKYASSMPGGKPVPTTVVEKVDPDNPSHGEVPGTHAYELRQADTAPDKVVDAPSVAKEELSGKPLSRFRFTMTLFLIATFSEQLTY